MVEHYFLKSRSQAGRWFQRIQDGYLHVLLILLSAMTLSCTRAVPELSALSSEFAGPRFNGNVQKLVTLYSLTDPVQVTATCDARVTRWLLSLDSGATWVDAASVFRADSQLTCSQEGITIRLDPASVFEVGGAQTQLKVFTLKGVTLFGDTPTGKLELRYTIDSTPATATITRPVAGEVLNAAEWANLQVQGTCSEELRPVQIAVGSINATVFCIGNEFSTSGLFAVPDDASVAISATHQDEAGNPPSTAALSVVKDTVAPAAPLTISGAPTGVSSATNVSIGIGGAADVTHYRYKIGAKNTTDCTTETGYSTLEQESEVDTALSTSISALPDGDLKLCVVARDSAGNYQAWADASSAVWTKDTVAPATPALLALASPATSPGNDPTPTIRVSGVANGDYVGLFSDSNCSQMLAQAAASGTEIEITVPTLAVDGTYNFYAKAKDGANQVSSCSLSSVTYQLDTEAPFASFTGGLPANSSNATTLGLVVGGDEVLTYVYKLGPFDVNFCTTDTGYSNEISVATPITDDITPLSDGDVMVCVRGKDQAGNLQAAEAANSIVWEKDTVKPTINIGAASRTIGNATKTFEWNVSYTGASSTTLGPANVTLSGAGSAGCTKAVLGAGSAYTVAASGCTGNGELSFSITSGTATDLAGNLAPGASPEAAVTVDNTAPNVSSYSNPPSVSTYFTIRFEFNENVTGLSAGDFTCANCLIHSLNGSGNVYHVVVKPTSTAVDVKLLANTVSDAAGNNGPPTFQRSSPTYTPGWGPQAYLKAPFPDSADRFGSSVAMSGDLAVVGAWEEDSDPENIADGAIGSDDNSKLNSGAVYVYRREQEFWRQEAFLKAPNADANDRFGENIAVHGDTIVVGAVKESANVTEISNSAFASSDNTSSASGAVYVFRKGASGWVQEAYLKASNAGAGDEFGSAVAVHGDTIAVGAFREDSGTTLIASGTAFSSDESVSNAGAVYIFRRSTGGWSQEAYIKAPNPSTEDKFGDVLALSGDTLVVGVGFEDSTQTTITTGASAPSDDGLLNSGGVYVFERDNTTWVQSAFIKSSNAGAGDYFGGSVAIHGDTLAVGAEGDDSNQTTISLTADTYSPDDGGAMENSGAVHIFERSGGAWSLRAYLKPTNSEGFDGFGSSIAISGNIVAVGAPHEDSNQTTITNSPNLVTDNNSADAAGAVYLFKSSGVAWEQFAYVKAPNIETLDVFGTSVALSGATLLVGAPAEDSNQNHVSNSTVASFDNSVSGAGAGYIFRYATLESNVHEVTAARVIFHPGGGYSFTAKIQYSDDATTWQTAAETTVFGSLTRIWSPAWSTQGSHRYWRIWFDASAAEAGTTVSLNEVRLENVNGRKVDLNAMTRVAPSFTDAPAATDGDVVTSATAPGGGELSFAWDFGLVPL